MHDLIDRQAAIDAVYKCDDIFVGDMPVMVVKADAYEALAQLPPAQPEKRTDKCTEMHACDLIDRQTAIDAILAVTGNSSVRELYEHVQEHGLSDMWSGGVNAAIDIIIAVPSAQPEIIRCKDCKWFHDIGCAIQIVDDSDKPSENDYCSFAERRNDEADYRKE